MFDNDYGTIEIKGQKKDIEKQSVEHLKKYLNFYKEEENKLIIIQNEYLSQLIG